MTSLLTRSGGLRPRGPPSRKWRAQPVMRPAATSTEFSFRAHDGLGLHGLSDDLLEHPALSPAERPGLDDGDRVAGPGLVPLVVHHEGRRAPLGLAVQPVAYLPLDGHDDATLHLVAEDDAVLFRFLGHVCSHESFIAPVSV